MVASLKRKWISGCRTRVSSSSGRREINQEEPIWAGRKLVIQRLGEDRERVEVRGEREGEKGEGGREGRGEREGEKGEGGREGRGRDGEDRVRGV